MRYLNLVLSALLIITTGSTHAYGQTNERPPPEGQFEPYHKHRDTHLGHDHFYPDRGSIVRDVPKVAATVSYAGLSYRFLDGIWYEPRGPAFMVVAPPIGLIVQSLPTFATLLARGGQVYVYCNDTFYRPRPDVNGYEVVNDPAESSVQAASDSPAAAAATASLAGASAIHAAAAPSAAAPSAVAVGAAPALAPASSAQTVATPLEESAKVSAPTPASAPTAVAAAPTPVAAAPTPVAAAPTAVVTTAPIAALPSTALAAPSTPLPSTGTTAAGTTATGLKVSLNPKQGQSAELQARDRYECYRFAVAQSGFDPMRGSSSASQSEYDRAQAACFDARGYAVR